MSPLNKPTTNVKASQMSDPANTSTTSVAAISGSRPTTPLPVGYSTPRSNKTTSSGLQRFFSRHYVRHPAFDMLTPPSRSTVSKPPLKISRLAKAFVDSLHASQLSDFLVWMLYHEIVELPEHAEAWYDSISSIDMRGWVALGQYVSEFSTALDTSHGFDLVVMDSICDRLGLQRSTVHSFLKHFADAQKMAFSQIATLVHAADAEGQSYIEVLEGIHAKLREHSRMAVRLKPTEGSIYNNWHAIIIKRLRVFISLVVEPRIANIRSSVPLVTAATFEQTPQVVKDGMRLNYLFELMQQKRQVPVTRYGVDRINPSVGLATPPSSPPGFHGASTPESIDQEHAHEDTALFHEENQHLRAQVSALQQDMKHFQHTNDCLMQKLILLGHGPASPSVPASSLTFEDGTLRLPRIDIDASMHTQPFHVPQKPTRPRSLSYNAALSLNQAQNPAHNHKRQRSEVLSWKYEDVFLALDPPSPSVRLSDPATGELLKPALAEGEVEFVERSPSRAVTFSSGAGRRSGMVFSKGQMDMLKAVREGTPRTSGEDGNY